MDDLIRITRIGAVAGIPIEHQVSGELAHKPSFEGVWTGSAVLEPPIVIRHGIGDVEGGMASKVFEIENVATYYDDGSDGITIRYHAIDPGMPTQVLRTVKPGHEYAVAYEFAPEFALPRRDKEMNAFAISLAARGRGIVAHGAGMVLPSGQGALCLGVSGTGKSTLAQMMLSEPDVHVLNDDRLAVTGGVDGPHLWSTPWPGRAGIALDGDAPLSVIALIGRGKTPEIREVPATAVLKTFLSTMALPVWSSSLEESLTLIDDLAHSVPVVALSYPLGPSTGERIVALLTEVAG